MEKVILTAIFLAAFLSNLHSQSCAPTSSAAVLDVNNVSALMLNGGDMWWDFTQSRYEIPKGSGKKPLFVNAMWMGGLDAGGTLHLAAQRYRNEGNDFWSGPIPGDTLFVNPQECYEYDRHWTVTRQQVEAIVNGNTQTIPTDILQWPARGNPNLPFSITQQVAPFVDVNGDGLYNPAAHGDHPLIKGDQAIYWVMNDIGNTHLSSGGMPLGIEVHVMAYAYATDDDLNNTTFYDYIVINKSGADYHDVFLSLFTDPDLGYLADDFVGCDTTRNLGICYNGDGYDEDSWTPGYGYNLPVTGIQVLQPIKNAEGEPLNMSSFIYTINPASGPTGDPILASEYYNYMRGFWKDGSPLVYGGTGTGNGTPTKFAYPANPAGTGWSECEAGNFPGDRRFIMSFGPFDLQQGDVKSFSYAALWAVNTVFQGICPDLCPFYEMADDIKAFSDSTLCDNFDISLEADLTAAHEGQSNGAIDLKVAGSISMLSYRWSEGSANEDLGGISSGTYTVTVSNEMGCSETASFQVNVLGITPVLTSEISLYPNPSTNGIFTIKGLNGSMAAVEIFNLLGEKVLERQTAAQIDLSTLPDGVYMSRVRIGKSQATTRVVIDR